MQPRNNEENPYKNLTLEEMYEYENLLADSLFIDPASEEHKQIVKKMQELEKKMNSGS